MDRLIWKIFGARSSFRIAKKLSHTRTHMREIMRYYTLHGRNVCLDTNVMHNSRLRKNIRLYCVSRRYCPRLPKHIDLIHHDYVKNISKNAEIPSNENRLFFLVRQISMYLRRWQHCVCVCVCVDSKKFYRSLVFHGPLLEDVFFCPV